MKKIQSWNYKVGDLLKVVSMAGGHSFDIGSKVMYIVVSNRGGLRCDNVLADGSLKGDVWWILFDGEVDRINDVERVGSWDFFAEEDVSWTLPTGERFDNFQDATELARRYRKAIDFLDEIRDESGEFTTKSIIMNLSEITDALLSVHRGFDKPFKV